MPEGSEALNVRIQIGEAARRAALSVDTIRFYERRALLPRAPRTTGKFRLYAAADVTRLSFIKQMKSLGFSPHGLACRLYSGGRSAPSVEALRGAIVAAKNAEVDR